MATLCLFDFDGTITRQDSFGGFIQYLIGKPAYYVGLLKNGPLIISYLLGLTANDLAKQKLLQAYFKEWTHADFEKGSKNYSLEAIDSIIRPQALEKINWHKRQGHTVVVVSASLELYLNGWCAKNDLQLIATRLKTAGDLFSAAFDTKNCYGQEKVERIKQEFNLATYDAIYAYGDSEGDRQMLKLADVDKAFYKPFR